MKGQIPRPSDFPPRWWLSAALTAYVINGGEETAETRAPLTLLLFDFFERRMSATRAGIEAAIRQRQGGLKSWSHTHTIRIFPRDGSPGREWRIMVKANGDGTASGYVESGQELWWFDGEQWRVNVRERGALGVDGVIRIERVTAEEELR